jgi:dihydrolipoamide dehydrogenase
MDQKFDLLIIGAGPGGYIAAEKAAKMGMDVVVIDKKELGGTCVNRGCIPTKALIHASTLYRDMKNCEQFGIQADNVAFDLQKIYNYKDDSSRMMRKELRKTFRELGITFIQGTATIQRNRKVRVKREDGAIEIFQAKNILIATGAKANIPDIPGMDLPEVMTSEELMVTNKSQYKRLLILGGGVIGLEIGTVFNNLGSEVTIIEANDRLLPTMDIEFSEAVEKILVKRGVELCENSTLHRVEQSGEALLCTYEFEGKEYQREFDGVLVSVGRSANTEDLFDSDVKIKTKNGKIVVDDFFMTSMPRVYAIGDVIEGVQLAHVASAQATFVVERMNEKEPSVILSVVPSCLFVSMSIIPSCLYMDPEIASVGLSEAAAKAKGVPIRCGECVMTDNGKSIINHDEEGFIKVVFAADSDVLLGAQIMCPRATDMIGELATAIANGLTSRQLMYAMRAHPTYNEAISTAVEASRRAVKK